MVSIGYSRICLYPALVCFGKMAIGLDDDVFLLVEIYDLGGM